MAFKMEIEAHHNLTDGQHIVAAKYSDILSLAPEELIHAIAYRIADKFVEEHYAEIASQIDKTVVAACVSAHMGAIVEERMVKEIERVNAVAQEALRRSKRR